jgi:TetR/AcrR family transcriptional regulator
MRLDPDHSGPAALARATTQAGEANRERILDAGLACFSRSGFAGTRLDAIAAAAGLSKANLLYYHRSKQDLYLAVLNRTLTMWLAPLIAIDPESDPLSALEGYVTRKLEAARDFPEASRLFALEIMQGAPILAPVLSGELKRVVDAKAELLLAWQREGRLKPHDPRHLIMLIWAMTQHYADFAPQVTALTGQGLADPAFFAEARTAIMAAVRGLVGMGNGQA